jgi:catechol 2,3-dioxygenase-like lactoylglutathione lyase family enzyme
MTLEIIEINHFQTTVPRASEEASKHFYGRVLGLEEIPKPTNLRSRGGAWYRQGAVQLHLSIEDPGTDSRSSRRHAKVSGDASAHHTGNFYIPNELLSKLLVGLIGRRR